MKYKEWLFQWLCIIKPTLKRCTYDRYLSYVKFQIIPCLGECELEELTARHIQMFMATLSGKYSPGTINCIIAVVKRSLSCAEELGVRQARLDHKVRVKLRSKREIRCLSTVNQKKLESYVNSTRTPKLYGITICLYTGLRVGELLALKWSDIDFENLTISVNKTCHDLYTEEGYEKLIDTPKTSTSEREIPLPRQLAAVLKKLRRESKSEFVISGKDGKVISKRSYQSTFSAVLKRLGLPHMGIHGLRHTFATRALECGMDVKTLSEILGHSNAAITLNCYVHSLPEHKRSMMNRVGKMLHEV